MLDRVIQICESSSRRQDHVTLSASVILVVMATHDNHWVPLTRPDLGGRLLHYTVSPLHKILTGFQAFLGVDFLGNYQ